MSSAASPPLVTGVDFVALPTHDLEAAAEFYGTTLGLTRSVYMLDRHFAEFETGNLTLSIIDPEKMGLDAHCQPQRDRPARRRHRGCAGAAGDAWRELRRRHVRHRRLPHGVLPRPRWQCADAAPPLRAARDRDARRRLSTRARRERAQHDPPRRRACRRARLLRPRPHRRRPDDTASASRRLQEPGRPSRSERAAVLGRNRRARRRGARLDGARATRPVALVGFFGQSRDDVDHSRDRRDGAQHRRSGRRFSRPAGVPQRTTGRVPLGQHGRCSPRARPWQALHPTRCTSAPWRARRSTTSRSGSIAARWRTACSARPTSSSSETLYLDFSGRPAWRGLRVYAPEAEQ